MPSINRILSHINNKQIQKSLKLPEILGIRRPTTFSIIRVSRFKQFLNHHNCIRHFRNLLRLRHAYLHGVLFRSHKT